MRVAVAQFATSLNNQDNLSTCVRMIEQAAECKPDLIILPEFCNTQFCNAQSGYADHHQAWSDALTIDGDFLQIIAEQAKKRDCYVVVNVTLRRGAALERPTKRQYDAIKANISVTSCLFSPLGKLIHQADKQTLTGREKDFFTCADQAPQVVTTSLGTVGLLAGYDDMSFDTSRGLALSGAQLLCHSMNSFALDQSRLLGPARACENKVFLASANKVGSLISQKESREKGSIFEDNFVGVGQSQIISPDGKVLARIEHNKEGFVFADIDLAESKVKLRPDSTELIKQQRPELYQALTQPVKKTPRQVESSHIPATVNVALFATYKSNEHAIEDVCHYIENNLSDVIQLPELFFITDKTRLNDTEHLAKAENMCDQLIVQVSAVLRPFQYVCTSIVVNGIHQAAIISQQGIFAAQQQLHFCQRYQWTALGDELNVVELPLEQGCITVAMLTADDANIPEIVKIAAINGIHLLLVPFDIQEPGEVEYSLLSRAAEHRICIVAASREKSFVNDLSIDSTNANNNTRNKNKMKAQKSTGFVANLTADFALLTSWKSKKFELYINPPLVKYQHGKITKALIHPIAACNK
jgi:predicted amidohydrolase